MSSAGNRWAPKHVETWLWTGPVGHFVAGALDLLEALARHLLARLRERSSR